MSRSSILNANDFKLGTPRKKTTSTLATVTTHCGVRYMELSDIVNRYGEKLAAQFPEVCAKGLAGQWAVEDAIKAHKNAANQNPLLGYEYHGIVI